MYINQAVTWQTRLQLVPAPPDPNQAPPGPDPARKPSRIGLGQLALTRCCRCESCDSDCIGVGMPPSPLPRRGDGDGNGVRMLTASLLSLQRRCRCSQTVRRQTRLQLVQAPPNPNRTPPGPCSFRGPGRSRRIGPAWLTLGRS